MEVEVGRGCLAAGLVAGWVAGVFLAAASTRTGDCVEVALAAPAVLTPRMGTRGFQILILHAETVVVGCMATMITFLYKQFGETIGSGLDDRADAIETALNVAKADRIASLEAQIAEEKTIPASLEAIGDLFAISKELGAMNRELAYRTALHDAADQVTKELNFYVQLEAENVSVPPPPFRGARTASPLAPAREPANAAGSRVPAAGPGCRRMLLFVAHDARREGLLLPAKRSSSRRYAGTLTYRKTRRNRSSSRRSSPACSPTPPARRTPSSSSA